MIKEIKEKLLGENSKKAKDITPVEDAVNVFDEELKEKWE